MGYKNQCLVKEACRVLKSKTRFGHSKHKDKLLGISDKYIYSFKTFDNYMQQCRLFLNFCRKNHNCKTLKECYNFINDYLQKNIDEGKSPWTISLQKSAIAKLYGVSSDEFVKTPSRKREKITRSRTARNMDKNFSQSKNKDLIEFCKSTGLRREELEALKGSWLKFDKKNEPYIAMPRNIGKGGKRRDIVVVGNKNLVIRLCREAGDGNVFKEKYSKADIHSYRAQYAADYYKSIKRPLEDIPQSQRYYCRGDCKGKILDKVAMLEVSKSLGHNRIDVIASNYAYLF